MVGPEKANEGVGFSNVALQAQDAYHRILIDEPWVSEGPFFLAEISRTVVRSEQQAKRVALKLASQLNRKIRIDDGACVNSRDLRLKNVDAFEKEGPLLRKEDWKALVGRDYQLIRLDLCK